MSTEYSTSTVEHTLFLKIHKRFSRPEQLLRSWKQTPITLSISFNHNIRNKLEKFGSLKFAEIKQHIPKIFWDEKI